MRARISKTPGGLVTWLIVCSFASTLAWSNLGDLSLLLVSLGRTLVPRRRACVLVGQAREDTRCDLVAVGVNLLCCNDASGQSGACCRLVVDFCSSCRRICAVRFLAIAWISSTKVLGNVAVFARTAPAHAVLRQVKPRALNAQPLRILPKHWQVSPKHPWGLYLLRSSLYTPCRPRTIPNLELLFTT